jgi:hypothetical protein
MIFSNQIILITTVLTAENYREGLTKTEHSLLSIIPKLFDIRLFPSVRNSNEIIRLEKEGRGAWGEF